MLQVEEGSLYPALQRLAFKGWVKAAWGQTENNRRARFYKMTPAGRKQLKQEVADFERLLEAILRWCSRREVKPTVIKQSFNSGAGYFSMCDATNSTANWKRKCGSIWRGRRKKTSRRE